jgi:ABC-type Fe3+/spermidine/putrescine transport system ATPase subunit
VNEDAVRRRAATGILRLERVTKRFGETTAVADLSLEVAPGELLTLLGPSGCGKTTTLRMIAGFESPTSGRILLDDQDLTRLPPQRRGFGMVFQNYALFPHLDVFENVAFGLKGKGTARAEIGRRVEEALALVDLQGYGKRKVQQLSGGQQQRVALARALAPEPRILLLDEPLSNLDAALRERTRAELRTLLERLGITAIFVTHDQEEAFELSDRIAIMQGGMLQQVGTPEALYLSPANPFVATFLGRANFLEGRVVEGIEGEDRERGGDGVEATGAASRWLLCELPGGAHWRVRAGTSTIAAEPGSSVRIMVRPEALQLLPPDEANETTDLPATILERRFAGPATNYRVRCGAMEIQVLGRPGAGRPGADVLLRLAPDAVPLAFQTMGVPDAPAAIATGVS